MNDMELVKWARECATIGGSCDNCPFDGVIDAQTGSCADRMVIALAERVEKLADRCARYAEEIALAQENPRGEVE